MDKLQWFKFTPSDYMMGKIQRCPEITQARFIRLCCLYWNKESNLTIDDGIIEIDKEHFDILTAKKVIKVSETHVIIDFLDEQLDEIAETSKGKSRAAKARWDKYKAGKKDDATAMQNDADAMHVHTDAMQNDADKTILDHTTLDKTKKDNTIFSIEIEETFDFVVELFDETNQPKTEKQITDWKDTIRQLNEIDGLEFTTIKHLVQKTREDDFWSKNFLTLLKLRKKDKNGTPYWNVFFNNFKTKNHGQTVNSHAELLRQIRRNNPKL